MPKSKTLIRAYFAEFFPAFKIPAEFEIVDLPRLWKEQNMDRRCEAILVINDYGNPEVREGPPASIVDDVNPNYRRPKKGRPCKETNDINRYWKRQGA